MAENVLIIGASRGLGHGLAKTFLDRGWTVTVTVRDPRAGPADLLARKARVLPLDLRDAQARLSLGERLPAAVFDRLVISAGVSGPAHQAAERAEAPELADLFTTNAVAPVALARALSPALKPGHGQIAFLGSRMGSVGLNDDGAAELYRASKAALNSLVSSFAVKDAAPLGLDVLVLHPGWVRTDMGGSQAPLSIEESASGLVEVMTKPILHPGLRFVDYLDRDLAW